MKKINKIQILILMLALLAMSVFAARLPTVNGDNEGWGSVLNTFLQVAHGSDGSINSDYVVSAYISDEAIGAIDIASDVVNTTHLVDGTIINIDIASGVINGSQVAQSAGLNISSLIVNSNNNLSRGVGAANISGIFINSSYLDLPSINGGGCFIIPINMTGIPIGINCFAMGDESAYLGTGAIRLSLVGLNSTLNNCRIRACNTEKAATDPHPIRFTALGIATGTN